MYSDEAISYCHQGTLIYVEAATGELVSSGRNPFTYSFCLCYSRICESEKTLQVADPLIDPPTANTNKDQGIITPTATVSTKI